MNILNFRKVFEQFIHIGCVFAAIGTTLWCVYIFFENNDVCLVDFKKYNEKPEYLSPSFSIAFANPFNESKLKLYGTGINTSSYVQFLKGEYWDERMLNINYDDVTIDITNYFLGFEIAYSNWTKYRFEATELNQSNGLKHPFVSFRHPTMKAFGVNPPEFKGETIVKLGVQIKTEIFRDSIRPIDMVIDEFDPVFGGIAFILHYPGQVLRSWSHGIGKWAWPKRKDRESKYYEMSFTRRNMDVLVRRNKYNNKCNEDWERYDKNVMENRIARIGCRPAYYYTSRFPICSTLEDMKKVAPLTPNMINEYDPPCRSISKLQFDYQDIDYDYDEDQIGDNVPYFTISATSLDTTFKLIELVRAYDVQSLIGNAGGYIGIFLGYTICQLPAVMFDACRWIKNVFEIFFQKNSSKRRNNSLVLRVVEKNDMVNKADDRGYEEIMKEMRCLKDEMTKIKGMFHKLEK